MRMQTTYDPNAPKRPTNLSINSDLLQQARKLDINLSAVLEQTLAEKVRAEQARRWRDENKQAVQQYNALVEDKGMFSDTLRSF